jgi:hypothetical protein
MLCACGRAAPDDTTEATEELATCPRANAAVVERFISADCDTCWTDKAVSTIADDVWLLDWIVPSARGDDAPLSSAAPTEAIARAKRALKTALPANRPALQQTKARAPAQFGLRIATGPAWNGYFGVQVDGSGHIAGARSVWIALVETVAAGTDGTAVPRQLVRTVAGPFELRELRDGQPWQLLQAMRWPDTAKAARLRARTWLEGADGRIVVMAGERCRAP